MSANRIVRVYKNHAATQIVHTVIETDADIKIETSLESFLAGVLVRIGSPVAILTRAALEKKIKLAVDDELGEMKQATVYKAVDVV